MANSTSSTEDSTTSSHKRKASNPPPTTTAPKRSKPTSPNPQSQTCSLLAHANSLPPESFQSTYLPTPLSITAKSGKTHALTFRTSTTLTPHECDACFSLLEATSSADYRHASQGWHPRAKRREMRERDMRYLLVSATSQPPQGMAREEEELLAFSSFMLTSEGDVPVLYIYEIHLREELRGTGVGARLMRVLESVGRKVGVQRCMLTVFTTNQSAEGFYRSLGYVEDEISPRERRLRGGKVKKPDYLILSKALGCGEGIDPLRYDLHDTQVIYDESENPTLCI